MGSFRYLAPVIIFLFAYVAIASILTFQGRVRILGDICCGQIYEDDKKFLESEVAPITFLTGSFKSTGNEINSFFAIRSNLSENATFEITRGFSCRPSPGVRSTEMPKFQSYENRTIQPRSSVILPINIKTPSTLTPGTYTCAIDLYFTSIGDRTLPTPQLYASKGFEVLVLDRNR